MNPLPAFHLPLKNGQGRLMRRDAGYLEKKIVKGKEVALFRMHKKKVSEFVDMRNRKVNGLISESNRIFQEMMQLSHERTAPLSRQEHDALRKRIVAYEKLVEANLEAESVAIRSKQKEAHLDAAQRRHALKGALAPLRGMLDLMEMNGIVEPSFGKRCMDEAGTMKHGEGLA